MTITNNVNRIYVAGHRGMVGSAIVRQLLAVPMTMSSAVHKSTYEQHISPMQSQIKMGCGSVITIAQSDQVVNQVVGYPGTMVYVTAKPVGAPQKLMDGGRLSLLGWPAKVSC